MWGHDVYTDDSDPLAAAVHSGWIRGEWGDGVDVSMFEILHEHNNASDPKQNLFTSPPPSPSVPPKSKDLHLTVLILPPLKAYTSSVAHGIKSRPWARDHDGMSYKIEKMSWVDEGVSAGEERSRKVKKARIKGLMAASTRGAGGRMGPVGMGPALKIVLGRQRPKVPAAA